MTTVVASAMFGLTPLAHVDTVIFDGSSWSATIDGSVGVTSSTTRGATTLIASSGRTNLPGAHFPGINQ